MVYKRRRSIFDIPYFKALAIWNSTQSPLQGIAWVIPYGPKKVPPEGSNEYKEVNEIRKNPPNSSSESSSATEAELEPPSPPSSPSPPSTKSLKERVEMVKQRARERTSSSKKSSVRTPMYSSRESEGTPTYKNVYIYPSKTPSYDISKDVEIKTSTIPNAGEGVFALKHLKAKQPIGMYQGRIITDADEVKKSKSKYIMEITLVGKNTFDADGQQLKHFWVDGSEEEGGNWTGKINHRRAPNVEFLQTGKFITKRAIRPGEELFIDYGKDAEYFLRSSSKTESESEPTLESQKRKPSSNSSFSGEHMLYHRPEHIRYVRTASSKGKEFKYIYSLIHDEGQLKSPVPKGNRVSFKFTPNIATLELGAGAYGNVYVGFMNGKKVAVKFQILNAPIPKSDCAMQSQVKECRTMTDGQFLKELQYISYAHEALGNMAPEILGVEYWKVEDVSVEPSLPPAERLKLPTKVASVAMPYIQGIPLYEITESLEANGQKENVTDTIMLAMKLLYDFKYDPYNEDKHLVWRDLHFGNVMETQPGDRIKFVDMGMLDETKDSWETVKKFYEERLQEEWSVL